MLEDMKPKTKDNLCGMVKKAMAELSEADQKIFFDALEDRQTWSGLGLTNALRERGFKTNKNSLQEHRNKACACAR